VARTRCRAQEQRNYDRSGTWTGARWTWPAMNVS
jgi:hypothetical protein